jgi:hypothetical protein
MSLTQVLADLGNFASATTPIPVFSSEYSGPGAPYPAVAPAAPAAPAAAAAAAPAPPARVVPQGPQAVFNDGLPRGNFQLGGYTNATVIEALFVGNEDKGALKDFVTRLSNKKDVAEYKGYRVYYLPTCDEVLKHLVQGVVGAHMATKLPGVNASTDAEVLAHAVNDTHVNQMSLNKWLGTSPFSDVKSSGKSHWDARVKMVQDQMVAGAVASGVSAFTDIKKAPGVLTTLPFASGTPRKPVESGSFGPVLASMVAPRYTLAVARGGFSGGSASAHAPLYPSVVMNGGSAPFAMYGGDDKSVANVKGKFVSMEQEFQRNSGKELSAAMGVSTKPSAMAEQLGRDIDTLIAAQTKLQNAVLALSTAPYAPGVVFKGDAASYDALAKAGQEINEKAAKVSRGWDKLSKIHDALEELLAKTKNVALSGGLHNALKH